MKRQIFKIVLISFLFFSFFNTVHADTTVHLEIETNTGSIYNRDITVAPCDNDGTVAITAYCALYQSGIKSDWSGPYGPLWINSINGIANNTNNNGIYWMWLVNLNTNNPYSDFNCHQDAPYSCSAKQYILKPNDNILFYYNIDPTTQNTPSPIGSGTPIIYITPDTTSTLTPASSSTPTTLTKPTFDIKKASDFLISEQKSDGSFGENLYTDWTALALAGGNYQEQIIKLVKYLEEIKIENISLTDSERHAMALMSLGLNPHNTNGINYIEKITNSFDGKQFGDLNEDNDDIFALIVLQNAGYTQNDKMINDDISFILNRQNENGSWDGSIDMTGAGIEALSTFNQNTDVKNALVKAENFLKQNQKDNGSWNNNVSSTAWALEGILALNEKPEDWSRNNNTPFDYLATIQDVDGGIKNESMTNKIWETAYVTSALSGKTWNQIMQKFEKPVPSPLVINDTIKIPVPEKENPKKVAIIKKNPSLAKKPKNINLILPTENTANVLNAVTTPPTTNQTENVIPKKNWWSRMLNSIFN